MALIDFTTFDDIRAALGVSVDELGDDTLSLPVYEFNLKDELSDAGEEVVTPSTLVADYSSAKGKDTGDRTAAEQDLVEKVLLFSTYVVAKHLTTTLPMFSPKEQTDGKASLVRFTQDPYKETVKGVEKLYDRYRTRLVAAYSTIKSAGTPVTTSRPYFVSVPASSDPVTGE